MARALLRVEPLDCRINPAVIVDEPLTAIGSGFGADIVTALNGDGSVRWRVSAFGGFDGGARVAVGDFTGDGLPEVVAATGPGFEPLVVVLDGATGAVIDEFLAFEPNFIGGVYVSAGDLDGDNIDDIVLSADEGGGPRVRVLSGLGVAQVAIADFFGIDDPNFFGGTRTAVGDFDGDGFDDLAVAAGFGGGPRIALFEGGSVSVNDPVRLINDFFAFEAGLRNGAFVGAGDLNADGFADLVFGGGPGGGPRVLAISSALLIFRGEAVAFSNPLGNFFAGNINDRDGVRVAVGEPDADDVPVLLTAGPGGQISGFSGNGQLIFTEADDIFGGFVAVTSDVRNPGIFGPFFR